MSRSMNNRARLRAAVAAVAALGLVSCETYKSNQEALPGDMKKADAAVQAAKNIDRAVNPVMRRVDRPYGGGVVIRETIRPKLPDKVETQKGYQIGETSPFSLQQLASRFTAETGIAMRLVDGCGSPPAARRGLAATTTAAATPGTAAAPLGPVAAGLPQAFGAYAGNPLAPPGAGPALPGAPVTSYGQANAIVPSYVGPASGYADYLAAAFGCSWEFNRGAIRLSRYVTRSWTFPAQSVEATTLIGTTGGGSMAGGSSGGSGSSNSGSSSSGGSGSSGSGSRSSSSGGSSLQQMTAEASTKMWADLQKALESMVPEGDFALMPSTGDVIITAPRDVMDRVEPIVSKLRAVASRQVTVNLAIVSYESDQQDAYALDLAATFQDAGFQVAFTGPSALSNVTGTGSYSTGFISPPPSNASSAAQKWAGTKAALQALSANNRLSVEYSTAVTTLSNTPVSLTNARSQGYLGSVTGATSTGTATLSGGASLSFALSGYTMIAIPRVLDDGRISLALGYSNASDATFVPVTSGQGAGSITLQSPDQTNQATGQFPVVRSGDTFVITGFAQDRRVLNESGVGWFWNWILGGGENAMRKRQRFALLVTPLQVDDEPASGSAGRVATDATAQGGGG